MARRMRTFDLPLRCRCGDVRGVAREVARSAGFRFVCYCRDCQAFARILERPDVLDAAGGTDIFQMPSARATLTAGKDAVRCLRFSRTVFRWYTECCRTPIANTAGPGFPVVALIHAFIGQDKVLRDTATGPPLCRIYEASATGPIPSHVPAAASLRIRGARLATILGWWLRGLGRPSPFFDGVSKAPLAAPVWHEGACR